MPMLPVRFFFRPSRMYGGLLAAFAAAAATSVLIIPIPIPARLALAALLVALFTRALWRYFSPGAAVRGVEFMKDGQVAVLNAAGAYLDFGGVIYRFVSPTISTVVIQSGAKNAGARRHAVVLMPDSMGRESYRRLRLRLNGTPLPNDGDE